MYVSSPVRFRLGELRFTWDPAKATTNVEKHGITFEEAATTWLDPLAIETPDEVRSDGEDRWLRIGSSLREALLVVWSAERRTRKHGTLIRIIGARRATRRERTLHEQGDQEDDST